MMLKASGITKEEAVEHPQAVLDVLAFHMDGPRANGQQRRPKMPSKESIAKTVTEVRCCVYRTFSVARDRLLFNVCAGVCDGLGFILCWAVFWWSALRRYCNRALLHAPKFVAWLCACASLPRVDVGP